MSKKMYWFIGGVILVVLGVVLVVLFKQGKIGDSNRVFFNEIKDKPVLVGLYHEAQAAEEKLVAAPDKPGLYLSLGMAWKGLGDAAQQNIWLQKSLAVYEDGIERFGKGNILFYLNAGKVAESIGDYAKAERYYRAAMTISVADESGYLYLADLYIYKLNKTKIDMLSLYAEAEKKVGNKSTVLSARGAYLKRIGDYAGALQEYQELAQANPQETAYQTLVAEMQAKLKVK